jgi:hypothetical protein
MANLPEIEKVVFRIPNGSGAVDSVEVDVCTNEMHTLPSTLTDHPVEQGANITDHSRPDPRRVTLECLQSNTPLTGTDGTDRARQLWQRFVDLHDNPKLISLDTVRDFYPSMAVESVTSPVDAKTSQALKFTLNLKEIRVVQNTFTQVVPTTDPRGQRKKDVGKVTTREVTASSTTTDLKAAFGKSVSAVQ